MKVAVVGSRDYANLDLVRRFIRAQARRHPEMVVVSGGARGVDSAAEQEARRCGLRVCSYPADWARLGKRAGMVRNAEIVNSADWVVAFYRHTKPGESPGTSHTLLLARKAKRPTVVFDEEGNQMVWDGTGYSPKPEGTWR